MALIDLPRPAPFQMFRRALASCAEMFGRPDVSPEVSDADRRNFAMDMLDENPDAFRSECDVQCMMNVYPGRF